MRSGRAMILGGGLNSTKIPPTQIFQTQSYIAQDISRIMLTAVHNV